MSLPGYWKGIGDRFEGVLVGYWWVLEGIGGYWRRAARDVALGVILGIIYKSLYNRDPTVHLDDLGGDSLEP